jgi:hypothetical protein
MKIHWEDSYLGGGGAGVSLIATSDNNGNGPRLTPRGFYLEVVARTDLAGGYPTPWMDLWSYGNNNTATGDYEIDGFEESGINGSTCNIHNNENGFNSACGPTATVDVSQYHTYAWRQTSAGTDLVFCAWIGNADGTNMVQQGCGSILPTSAQLNPGAPTVHQFDVGANGPQQRLNNGSVGKNAWLKSVKVWSCSTDPNNVCNSSSNNP